MSVTWMFALVPAAYAVERGVRRWRERRRVRHRVRRLPEATSDVRDGEEVRITGVVRALDETLDAPLSGRACVLYRAGIRANAMQPFARTQQRSEAFAMRAFAIELADDRRVVVDGDYAEIDLPETPRRAFDPARRETFRVVQGVTGRGLLRFDEMALEPGAYVTVVGFAMYEVADAARGEVGFRDTATRVRLGGSRARPLTISAARPPRRSPDRS